MKSNLRVKEVPVRVQEYLGYDSERQAAHCFCSLSHEEQVKIVRKVYNLGDIDIKEFDINEINEKFLYNRITISPDRNFILAVMFNLTLKIAVQLKTVRKCQRLRKTFDTVVDDIAHGRKSVPKNGTDIRGTIVNMMELKIPFLTEYPEITYDVKAIICDEVKEQKDKLAKDKISG